MDGLSAAASGIAVVSLAIQLVDSVREIRRFLRNVSEAPKELRRLIDMLEQLELVLENIGALVERQKQQAAEADVDVSGSILKAMTTCESKLKMIEDVVEVAKKNSSVTSKPARTFGSFRLACKRRDIEEFEGQLRDAISLLNLTMTVNLT
jgi:Fungal N-terminal domain of STAND proteins